MSKQRNCRGCCYRRPFDGDRTACYYFLDTMETRDSDPKNCDKKRIDKNYKVPKLEMRPFVTNWGG
ncbi:MAG: hypothetical protein GX896_03150 [Clostridiales bacterium]|nr:hypothetical protein [Clostridiales bacterium]